MLLRDPCLMPRYSEDLGASGRRRWQRMSSLAQYWQRLWTAIVLAIAAGGLTWEDISYEAISNVLERPSCWSLRRLETVEAC